MISLCEIKFTDEPFSISRSYAAEPRNKIERFRQATRRRKATHLVLVTSQGVRENQYSRELVDRELTLADLFR